MYVFVCACVWPIFIVLSLIIKKKNRTACCEIFVEWRRSTEVSTISFRGHSFYLYNLRILFAVQSLIMKLNKNIWQLIARHGCNALEMNLFGMRNFFKLFSTQTKNKKANVCVILSLFLSLFQIWHWFFWVFGFTGPHPYEELTKSI